MDNKEKLKFPKGELFTEDVFHKHYGNYPFTYSLKKFGINSVYESNEIHDKVFDSVGSDILIVSLLAHQNMVMINQEFGFKAYLSVRKCKDTDYYMASVFKNSEDENMFTNVLPTIYFKYIDELNFYLHCYNKIFETNEQYTKE